MPEKVADEAVSRLQIDGLTVGRFDLQTVIIKPAAVLRTFCLTNTSPSTPIDVTISHDFSDGRLTFQRASDNENLHFLTSTESVYFQTQHDEQDELFNDVMLVSTLRMAPGQKEILVAVFRLHRPLHGMSYDDSEMSQKVRGNIVFLDRAVGTDDESTNVQKIRVRATLCKSSFTVDAEDVTLECEKGSTELHDMCLTNHSNVNISVQLDAKEHITGKPIDKDLLSFVDTSNSSRVKAITIPPLSSQSLHLLYRSSEIGQRKIDIFFRNSNNLSNLILVPLLVNVVLSKTVKRTLIELDASNINFGNCFRGKSYFKPLSLRNVSDDDVEVTLWSQKAKKAGISFHPDGAENKATPMQPTTEERLKKRTGDIEKQTIHLRPGEVTTARICYRPMHLSDTSKAQLSKLTSQSSTAYATAKLVSNNMVQDAKKFTLSSQVCTSFITLSTKGLRLGDCQIGVLKTARVMIDNVSELPAHVSINYKSKVIRFRTHSLVIPPQESVETIIDFVPRKVNPDYCKQVTFSNLDNPDQEELLEISANNIDDKRFSLHASYYKLKVYQSRSYLYFGTCVLNSPNVRTCTIRNVSGRRLVLRLSTSLPDQLFLFQVASEGSRYPIQGAHRLTPTLKRRDEDVIPVISALDLATKASTRSFSTPSLAEADEGLVPPSNKNVSKFTPELLDLWGRFSANQLTDDDASEQHIHRLKILDEALREGWLKPVSTLQFDGEDEQQSTDIRTIVVVFRPDTSHYPNVKAKPKKINACVMIEMVDFDKNLCPEMKDEESQRVPMRELVASAKILRSSMSLAQKNFNFGAVPTSMCLSKRIILTNTGEVPLLYRIVKGKKIDAFSFSVDERSQRGCVNPYSTREIKFTFQPKFPGKFKEKILIQNVFDSSSSKTVTVKANVVATRRFFINSLDLNWEYCLVNSCSDFRSIVVTNTSKKKRTFRISSSEPRSIQSENTVTPSPSKAVLLFRADQVSVGYIDEATEVKLSDLERQMRIAKRKGNDAKLKMLVEEINKISRAKSGGTSGPDIKKSDLSSFTRESVTFVLEASESFRISAVLLPKMRLDELDQLLSRGIAEVPLSGSIYVYEVKNRDDTKAIDYTASVVLSAAAYRGRIGSTGQGEADPTPIDVLGKSPSVEKLPLVTKPRAKSTTKSSPLYIPQGTIRCGKISVHHAITQSFQVTNKSNYLVPFQLELDESKWDEQDIVLFGRPVLAFTNLTIGGVNTMPSLSMISTLPPGAVATVEFSLTITWPGVQKQTVCIRCLDTQQRESVMLSLEGTMTHFSFPQLGNSADSMLDLGSCYYNTERSKPSLQYPLTIRSMHSKQIFVSVKSNLEKQVFVYLDAEKTQPCQDVGLPPGDSLTVLVFLYPAKPKSDRCRELVGGLQVTSYMLMSGALGSNEDKKYLPPQTLKFRALVAKSAWTVAPDPLYIVDQPHAPFTICNSSELPFRFRIEPNPRIEVSYAESELPGAVKGETPTVVASLRVNLPGYGLTRDTVDIWNAELETDRKTLEVISFVSDGSLCLKNPLPILFSTIPLLDLGIISVSPITKGADSIDSTETTDGWLVKPVRSTFSSSLTFENTTNRAMQLRAVADFPALRAIWASNDPFQSRSVPAYRPEMTAVTGELNPISDDIVVEPHSSAVLSIECLGLFRLPKSCDAEESLRMRRTVCIEELLLESTDVQSFDLAVEATKVASPAPPTRVARSMFFVTFDVSFSSFEVSPDVVDLGSVVKRKDDKWSTTRISVNNKSDVNYDLEIASSCDSLSLVEDPQEINTGGSVKEGRLSLSPMQKSTFLVCLQLKDLKLPAGEHIHTITLRNTDQLERDIVVTVKFTVMTALFNIAEITDEDDVTLHLPPLTVPSPPSSNLADNWFRVVNAINKSLKMNSQLELDPQIADILTMKVVLHDTNVPADEFEISPHEYIDLRVRASGKDEVTSRQVQELIMEGLAQGKHPDEVQVNETNESPSEQSWLGKFGVLRLKADGHFRVEECNIMGSIHLGAEITLSKPRLTFWRFGSAADSDSEEELSDGDLNPGSGDEEEGNSECDRSHYDELCDSFAIRNELNRHFCFSINVPEDAPFDISVSPASGEIKALSECSINVTLLPAMASLQSVSATSELQIVNTTIGDVAAALPISFSSRLSKEDIDRPHSRASTGEAGGVIVPRAKSVDLKLPQQSPVLRTPSPHEDARPGGQELSPAADDGPPPTILLQGCNGEVNKDERYQIDFGKHRLPANRHEWWITLEHGGPSNRVLPYRLYPVVACDWLRLNRSSGTLSHPGDKQNIRLKVKVTELGDYSTYLLLENGENVGDIKTIRLSIHILASDAHSFNIRVSGLLLGSPQAPIIDYGKTVYGHVCTNRAISIRNTSGRSLGFWLNTDLAKHSKTEVNFSQSRRSARLVRHVVVPPGKNSMLHLRFLPLPDVISPTDIAEDVEVQVLISCVQVRSFKYGITLKAKCSYPQFYTPTRQLRFVGKTVSEQPGGKTGEKDKYQIELVSKQPLSIELKSSYHPSMMVETLQQPNAIFKPDIASNKPIRFRVMNETQFFKVLPCDGEFFPNNAAGSLIVSVRPESLKKHRRLLFSERYLEEHIRIYNPDNMSENYVVYLRFTIGREMSFYFALSPRNSHPNNRLEEMALSFVQDFRSYWNYAAKLVKNVRLSQAGQHSRLPSVGKIAKRAITLDRRELFFRFQHVVDEIIFFALNKGLDTFPFRMANLLFCALMKDEVFSREITLLTDTNPTNESNAEVRNFLREWLQPMRCYVDTHAHQTECFELMQWLKAMKEPGEEWNTHDAKHL